MPNRVDAPTGENREHAYRRNQQFRWKANQREGREKQIDFRKDGCVSSASQKQHEKRRYPNEGAPAGFPFTPAEPGREQGYEAQENGDVIRLVATGQNVGPKRARIKRVAEEAGQYQF